jgi:hypothetical protein
MRIIRFFNVVNPVRKVVHESLSSNEGEDIFLF